MAQVMIVCPETGKHVYTGLNFDWFDLDAYELGEKTVVKCSECGQEHKWTKDDAFLRADGGGD